MKYYLSLFSLGDHTKSCFIVKDPAVSLGLGDLRFIIHSLRSMLYIGRNHCSYPYLFEYFEEIGIIELAAE